MRGGTGIVVIRTVIAALVLALGVVSLASGRVFVGVLLVALAAMNVTLTVTVRRRRARLFERFPGLARRDAGRRTDPAGTVPATAHDR